MQLKQLEAYRNEILRQRDASERLARRHPGALAWPTESDAIERARAALGMCYIARAEARAAGKPEFYSRFGVVPRPPVKARVRP